MDVIGGVSAVITVIGGLTKLAKGLNEVRERYNSVALNITLVASQLSIIRAALEAIVAWREIAHSASQVSRQLDEDLATSLDCCAVLIMVIDSKLSESGYSSGMKAKVRYLWLENVLQGYISNLEGQVRALHLLLTVFQCSTATEQSQRLEYQENRAVIEHLSAERTSLKSNTKDYHDAVSTLSATPSVLLEIDSILLESPAYKKVYDHYMVHRTPVVASMNDDLRVQAMRAMEESSKHHGNFESTLSNELNQRIKELEQQLKDSESAHQDTKSVLAAVEKHSNMRMIEHARTKSKFKSLEQEWAKIQRVQESTKPHLDYVRPYDKLLEEHERTIRDLEVVQKQKRNMEEELKVLSQSILKTQTERPKPGGNQV